ncbi:MAG: transglycosylase domain-containing protein [Chloroflexi bacterium]|nr:transglycosylase domain-containing protein [Chloroflexota bacterium]
MDEENAITPSQEEPRERFRRLMDEASKVELEAALVKRKEENERQLNHEEEPQDSETRALPVKDALPADNILDKNTIPPKVGQIPHPPQLGTTPIASPPAMDTRGMPLPRRVDEIDRSSTRVIARAVDDDRSGIDAPSLDLDHTSPKKRRKKARFNPDSLERSMGCILRMAILGLFITILLALVTGSAGLIIYRRVVKDLPDPSDIRQRVSQFETTRILDKDGNVLYEILDPSGGRRTYVSLEDISPYLVAATIATEDKEFYSHPGFDAMAIARAFWQNLMSKETVSGASTITQQLTRALFLGPDERVQQSYARKLREALLAAEVTRRYTKNEILELYLNEFYYGNFAYGVEAASETYFGVQASELNLGQAAFLAGLPQLPAVYDVYTNRDATLYRQQTVLLLMYQVSQEKGCIQVGNSTDPVCVEAPEAAEAANSFEGYEFQAPYVKMRYPHWVNYVRTLLEAQYDSQTIYRSGFTVYTSLDPTLQDIAQEIVQKHVAALAGKHVTNGAAVILRPSTGEILAMVGSADFDNVDISGQVNMAVSPRQPGSSIKPLTYVAAFEKGWTPATLIWDVESEFPPSGDINDPRPPYIPVNYDNRVHGPMTVRTALANSFNIPAVKALDFIGIYDDPETPEEEGLIAIARRLGINTFTRDDYGLSLTLGGGDVTLLELSGVFAVFANRGEKILPVAIMRIEDHLGNEVYQYEPPYGDQVLRAEHAFLISSILSDNQARSLMFGPNSVINLPFQAAAKTGTTNNFRDNWTIGYTPDVVVGTWVGNADYTPMQGTSGLTGAAPIWAAVMKSAVQSLTGGNPTPFVPPTGIVEKVICSISGTEPSQWCPSHRSEFFVNDQLPLVKGFDIWQRATIDTWTELLASPSCSEFIDHKISINVTDPWGVKWIKETNQGKTWAEKMGFKKPIFFTPEKACRDSDSRPVLAIIAPRDGERITTSPVILYGQVDATSNFESYRLEYGHGRDPVDWTLLRKRDTPIGDPDEIYSWDVSQIPEGVVTIRLIMFSTRDTSAEFRMTLDLAVPTPTPTPTFTPTETPTPTITLTPTATFQPTATSTSTLIPTDAPTPNLTPSPE